MTSILNELMVIREELNAKSDELTRRITAFEEDLAKLTIGLTCWVKVDDKVRIGYMRFGDHAWHLAAEFTGEKEKNYCPAAKATRNIRLLIWNRRNEILAELLETAKTFTGKLDEALRG